MKNLIFIFLAFGLTMACKSNKSTTTSDRPTVNERAATDTRSGRQGKGQRKGSRPSIDEIFQMDANGDGLLGKTEVKGRLLKEFAKIDTNGDNLLSREEVKNAPRPERGQRPARNQ